MILWLETKWISKVILYLGINGVLFYLGESMGGDKRWDQDNSTCVSSRENLMTGFYLVSSLVPNFDGWKNPDFF